MRNTLFAAAAAFALTVGTAPTFAASSTQGGGKAATEANPPAAQSQIQTDSSAVDKNCADILANKADHSAAEVAQCQKQ